MICNSKMTQLRGSFLCIVTMSLFNCGLTKYAGIYIASIVSSCIGSLYELDVGRNKLRDDGFALFVPSLASATKFEILRARGCGLTCLPPLPITLTTLDAQVGG